MIATEAVAVPERLRGRRWTYEELCRELPESNQPTELWDGELTMSPSPSYRHQRVAFQFQQLLEDWARRNKAGEAIGAPIDMILSPRRVTQPDVAFISKERLSIRDNAINGPVDLAAEVISPTSRTRDRIEKRDLYEQHGVKEYWMIDPEAETVEVLFLEKGEYRLTGRWRPGEQAESRLLSDFVVNVADLFAQDV